MKASAWIVFGVAALAAALGVPAPAAAGLGDEQALAERYAPVVRLVEQPHECGPGEPYEPIDVNAIFGQPTVALRGPWNAVDLVKVAAPANVILRAKEKRQDGVGVAVTKTRNNGREVSRF